MGKLVICALRLLIMCECVNWRYVTLVDFAERREQRVSLISGVFFKKGECVQSLGKHGE